MPQMAPMWWTIIFIMSMVMFVLTTIMTYFNYNKIIKSNIKKKTYKMNWMW